MSGQGTSNVGRPRASSSGIQPSTHQQRLPLTPRSVNTPYVRPQQRHALGVLPRPSDPQPQGTVDWLQKVLDEVRRGREEQKGIKEDLRKVTHLLSKLEEEYKKLNEHIQQRDEASVTIESSVFKDDMIKEVGTLFVKSLERQPSRQDIGQCIIKVLRNEGKTKSKFNKARTFCYNRLTDLRCEERRRLFGLKPYQVYAQLTTEDFAERFMVTIKAAADEERRTYIRHLILLRKFSREVTDARNDTYKKFREWLTQTYPSTGCPTDEEWEELEQQDRAYNYKRSTDDGVYLTNYHDDVDQDGDGGYVDDSADGRGGFMVDAEVNGNPNMTYNPQMHTF